MRRISRHTSPGLLLAGLLLAVPLPVSAAAAAFAPVLEPPASGGLGLLDEALVRLSGHRRLLIVGAHPDDEDNALLAYVSRGLGGEVAYLSMSRGEGGQNLIGSELGSELGVIRSGELLAARALENGRQYFTRAYDFGYTRSLDETFSRWPRQILQRDAVRVARRFMPQVVVAVFPASERARHGQHQASAVIARDLFESAGEADVFADLEAEGLEPWEPRALYRRSWGMEEATVAYRLGALDPLSGRSLGQLAAASRSLHRSQDMGRVERIGDFPGGLVWLAGGSGAEATEVFDGIDTRLAAIADPLEDGAARERLAAILGEVERLAKSTRSELSPIDLRAAIEPVARIVELLADGARLAREGGSLAVASLVEEKRRLATAALMAAAGVVIDARLDRKTVTLGTTASLEVDVWSGAANTVVIDDVAVESPAGWIVSALSEVDESGGEPGVRRWRGTVDVPLAAAATRPYFLERPLRGDLYDWEGVPAAVKGEPFAPPPLVAVFDLEIGGAAVQIEREVVHRFGDQAVGEIRRPLRAVPPVEVEIGSESLLWRRGAAEEQWVEVVVRSNLDRPISGRVSVDDPAGWSTGGRREFSIDEERGSRRLALALRPAGTPEPGKYRFHFAVEMEGLTMSGSYPVLEYPHIRPRAVRREAVTDLTVMDLEIPEIDALGYVVGAADRVPAVLDKLGLPLTVLSGEDLRLGDLDRFDAIVVGSRAYEIDADLRAANSRLLDYVRRGGRLVVQYQQYQFVEGRYAPFPLEIGRPHGRVTDESAAVRHLVAEDPLLEWPNPIGPDDWQGWVQERGLYFPGSWDERFRPLLAMADPEREEERGALLVAKYGDGTYIYTGLSFFRQLPAGVPGAIRLFANLLAAGEDGVE